MADIQISVDAGTQTRLLTSGKYCKDDILVTAGSGGGDDGTLESLISRTITTFSNDTITSVGIYAFANCSDLMNFSSKSATEFSQLSFTACTSLETVYAPKVSILRSQAFSGCTAIKVLKFYSASQIYDRTFLNCSNIIALVLDGQSVCTLTNKNSMIGTPIESGTGYIYVPDNLVDQYKVATNWSIYANRIKGLSEIPAEVQEWLDKMEAA